MAHGRFFTHSTVLPLTVVSDALGCFEVAAILGACHYRTVTGGAKASVELQQFRCVNTLISNIKTALSGTYHSVKFAKYAHRHLAEVHFRFNRRYDLRAILGSLIRSMVAAPPSPGRGIRVAEHRRLSGERFGFPEDELEQASRGLVELIELIELIEQAGMA